MLFSLKKVYDVKFTHHFVWFAQKLSFIDLSLFVCFTGFVLLGNGGLRWNAKKV